MPEDKKASVARQLLKRSQTAEAVSEWLQQEVTSQLYVMNAKIDGLTAQLDRCLSQSAWLPALGPLELIESKADSKDGDAGGGVDANGVMAQSKQPPPEEALPEKSTAQWSARAEESTTTAGPDAESATEAEAEADAVRRSHVNLGLFASGRGGEGGTARATAMLPQPSDFEDGVDSGDFSPRSACFGTPGEHRETGTRSDGYSAEPSKRRAHGSTASAESAASAASRFSHDSRMSKASQVTENIAKIQAWIEQRHRKRSKLAEDVWHFLEEPSSRPAAQFFERVMLNVILGSVFFTISQALDPPPWWGFHAFVWEVVIDCLFILEICLRFCVCPNRLQFWMSPYNLIDIFASAPLILRLAICFGWLGLHDRDDSWPHILLFSFVPVLRLLKVIRRFQQFHLLMKAFRLALEALPVLLFIYFTMVLTSTACIYAFESRDNIDSLTKAAWLSIVSLTTVGYGDVYPMSAGGKATVSVLVVTGSLYMAIPLGIIGHCFSEVWADRDRILLLEKLKTRLGQWGYKAYDIPQLFRHFDTDKNDLMTLTEFKLMADQLKLGLAEERITHLFDVFDSDANGCIDCAEFVQRLFPASFHELYDDAGREFGQNNSTLARLRRFSLSNTSSFNTNGSS